MEDLMTPKPFIAPDLHKTEGLEPFKGWSKILDDVVGTVSIEF